MLHTSKTAFKNIKDNQLPPPIFWWQELQTIPVRSLVRRKFSTLIRNMYFSILSPLNNLGRREADKTRVLLQYLSSSAQWSFSNMWQSCFLTIQNKYGLYCVEWSTHGNCFIPGALLFIEDGQKLCNFYLLGVFWLFLVFWLGFLFCLGFCVCFFF